MEKIIIIQFAKDTQLKKKACSGKMRIVKNQKFVFKKNVNNSKITNNIETIKVKS